MSEGDVEIETGEGSLVVQFPSHKLLDKDPHEAAEWLVQIAEASRARLAIVGGEGKIYGAALPAREASQELLERFRRGIMKVRGEYIGMFSQVPVEEPAAGLGQALSFLRNDSYLSGSSLPSF